MKPVRDLSGVAGRTTGDTKAPPSRRGRAPAMLGRYFGLFTLALLTFGPGLARAQLFSDNFNRTTGLGSSWRVWYGGYTTDGTYAVSGPATPNDAGNFASVVTSLGTNDYSVAADVLIPSGSLYSGIVARGSAQTDFTSDLYAAQLSTDGAVRLYRRNAWTWTLLGVSAAGVVANTRYALQLVTRGSSPVHLEVWLDGVQRITYDDSSASRITSGAPGLENWDPNVRYDSFTVSAATSAGPAPTIASFSPTSGGRGDTVSIAGTNFTGATSVTVGGVTATFATLSSTSILAVVPAGAATGSIRVANAGGAATSSATFTVTANGSILASNNANLPVGSWVGTDPDNGDPTIMTFAYEGGSRVSLTEVGSSDH